MNQAFRFLGRCELRRSKLRPAFLLGLILCGCGGASGSAVPGSSAVSNAARVATASPAPAGKAAVPVTFRYVLPAASSATASSTRASRNAMRRAVQGSSYNGYTSTANPITINLNVTPAGGATTPYSGTCTAAGGGTSGTCTITFTATPGPTAFAGTLTELGNTIATFSQLEIVAPGAANAINFTANPVVAAVSLTLASGAVPGGTAAETSLVLNATDANGNIIAGTAPYVDSNGKPVAFVLTTVNTQAGGHGTVTIHGPARITAPGQQAVYAQYDGNWLQSAAINVSSTSNLIAAASTTLTITPTFYTYPLPDGNNSNYVTSGPDGNIWATECGGGGGPATNIEVITTAGNVIHQYTNASFSNCQAGIVVGSDGNMWFADNHNDFISEVSTSGVFSPAYSGSFGPVALVKGPDGNVWFTLLGSGGGQRIGQITPSGQLSLFSLGGGAENTGGIGVGPDQKIWFVNETNTKIGFSTIAGKITEYGGVASDTSGYSEGMVAGPDGNLWSTEYNAGSILVNSTAGVKVAEISLAPAQYPQQLTVGPDGNIWTADNSGNISQINAATKTLMNTYAAGPGGYDAGPSGICVGPDGNLWIADQGQAVVGKFVL